MLPQWHRGLVLALGVAALLAPAAHAETPPPPSISLSTTSLAFGAVVVGQEVELTLTVTGTSVTPADVTRALSGPEAARFTVTDDCPGAGLADDATCEISVTYDPTALGQDTATLTVSPGSHAVSLTGRGFDATVVDVSDASLAFGNQTAGTTSAAQTVEVTNDFSSRLYLDPQTTTGFGVTPGAGCTTFDPGDTCLLSVTFSPTAVGPANGTLSIGISSDAVSTAARSVSAGIQLTGTGTPSGPAVTTSPTTLGFGTIRVGETQTKTLTINSVGGAAATLTAFTISGTDFTLDATACSGGSVAPGSSCDVEVTFSPSELTARSGTLTFDYGAGTATVDLSGVGFPDALPPGGVPDPAPAGATSTNVTFSNSGQSIWSSGSALSTDQYFQLFHESWDVSGCLGGVIDVYFLGAFLGSYGAEVCGSTSGEIGARFHLHFDSGTADVTFPTRLDLTPPTANSFKPGQTIRIDTGWTLLNGAALDATSPQAFVALEAILEFGAKLSGRGCFVGCVGGTIFDKPRNNVGWSELFRVGSGADLDVGFLGVPGLGGTIGIPLVDPLTSSRDGDQLVASGSDQYGDIDLNLTELATYFGLPPLSLSVGCCGASLTGTLFSASFGVDSTHYQTFTFDGRPRLTLNLPAGFNVSWTVYRADGTFAASGFGNSIALDAGDIVDITTPASMNAVVNVGGSAGLNNSFTARFDDGQAFGLDFEAFSVSISIFGYTNGFALWEEHVDLFSFTNNLFTNSFSMGGFGSNQGVNGVSLDPELPPVLDHGGPYELDEGDTVQLSALGSSDPDGDDLLFAWDLDGDAGNGYETAGPAPVFWGEEGPAVHTVGLQVCDTTAQGAADDCVTGSTTITVTNTAPTVAAGADQAVTEGILVGLAPATFNDLGITDGHSAAIDWGDGTAAQAATVAHDPQPAAGTTTGRDGTVSGQHVYADDGTYTVTVTVTDDDGDVGTDTLTVTVGNALPTVEAGAAQTVDEGTTVSLGPASFNDKGTLDVHTATIDWDDGTAIDAGTVTENPTGPPGSTAGADGQVAGSHVYADDGVYDVDVCVTDDDGGARCDTVAITVENVTPAIDAGGDHVVDEGALLEVGVITLGAVGALTASTAPSFHDQGTLDTHTSTIDWGDGSPLGTANVTETPFGPPGSVAGADGTIAASHHYGDNGTYTATLCVTDDDGAEACDQFQVVVTNVTPTLALSHEGAIQFGDGLAFIGRVGDSQRHAASGGDAGSDDLSFSWSFPGPAIVAGQTHVHFNDGASADPLPSPLGVFPFGAEDPADVTFAGPGVYLVRVVVTDDDGAGSTPRSLPKLVVDTTSGMVRPRGWWQAHYGNAPRITAVQQQTYVDVAEFASRVFGDTVPLGDPDDADVVLSELASEDTHRAHALGEVLAAWLNFARGSIGWADPVAVPGDGTVAFHALLARAEDILLDANAGQAELQEARTLALAANTG